MRENQKELKWGETPWDHLDKADLLRTVQRMYSAVLSLHSALSLCNHNDERSGYQGGYWGFDGTGGVALERGRQVLDPIHEEYSEEDIYRSFFRYANDLLFDRSRGYRVGFGWTVCPVCGLMIGENMMGESLLGKRCSEVYPRGEGRCEGIFRELTWEDLLPGKGAE